MRKFVAIAKESYWSHYGDRKSLIRAMRLQVAINTVIAGLFVATVNDISKDALGALVTFLSIMIGFSYSVMIFVSSNPFVRASDADDRELKLRAIRLNSLVEKLYKNLHYFCIFSLVLVFISVFGILISTRTNDVARFGDTEIVNEEIVRGIANFVFVWVSCELLADFFRILDRTNYLFSDRIRQFRD